MLKTAYIIVRYFKNVWVYENQIDTIKHSKNNKL